MAGEIETRKRADAETQRRGDTEKERNGAPRSFAASPCERQECGKASGAALPADAPAEGWYQVDLEGRWDGHPAGAYALTPEDIRGIVDYFNRTCRANGVDLPVDYEHNGVIARLLGKSAESAGWINALEARNGGTELWAHIRWVEEARGLIRERKFRYLSSRLTPNYKDPISGRLIPWALDSVALTNRPFKKELPGVANSSGGAQPLSAEVGLDSAQPRATAPQGREEGTMDGLLALLAAAMSLEPKAVANSLGVQEDAETDVVARAVAGLLDAGERASKQVKLFANSLGVAEGADEPSVAAAIAKLKVPSPSDADVKILSICNAIGATPERPLEELLALIGAQRTAAGAAAAERLVENAISAEHKITPANREGFLRLALKDLEGTRKILNSMPSVLGAATNGSAAAEATALTEADQWVIAQHGLKKEEYLEAKKKLAG